jgi:hypothetical protein
MTPKGANLEGSDLLEVSTLESGSYVTRSITGQEIIDAASGTGVTAVTGTAPIASTGGSTPAISIATANTSTNGALSSMDWNTFNGKQAALVSGTNIKTINSTSLLGSGDVAVQPTLVSGTNIKTIEGQSLLGAGNINLTATDVGLGNVDNTSDANKPVSTATQTALNLKQDTLVSATNIKTINGSSVLGSGNLDVFALVPIQTVTSSATVTPTSSNQLVVITAQATALTFAVPTGTPAQGQPLMIRIKDNGTARAITWTSGTGGYRAIGVTLPTTTVVNKTTYVGCIYNSTDSRWDVIGVTTEA